MHRLYRHDNFMYLSSYPHTGSTFIGTLEEYLGVGMYEADEQRIRDGDTQPGCVALDEAKRAAARDNANLFNRAQFSHVELPPVLAETVLKPVLEIKPGTVPTDTVAQAKKVEPEASRILLQLRRLCTSEAGQKFKIADMPHYFMQATEYRFLFFTFERCAACGRSRQGHYDVQREISWSCDYDTLSYLRKTY